MRKVKTFLTSKFFLCISVALMILIVGKIGLNKANDNYSVTLRNKFETLWTTIKDTGRTHEEDVENYHLIFELKRIFIDDESFYKKFGSYQELGYEISAQVQSIHDEIFREYYRQMDNYYYDNDGNLPSIEQLEDELDELVHVKRMIIDEDVVTEEEQVELLDFQDDQVSYMIDKINELKAEEREIK